MMLRFEASNSSREMSLFRRPGGGVLAYLEAHFRVDGVSEACRDTDFDRWISGLKVHWLRSSINWSCLRAMFFFSRYCILPVPTTTMHHCDEGMR